MDNEGVGTLTNLEFGSAKIFGWTPNTGIRHVILFVYILKTKVNKFFYCRVIRIQIQGAQNQPKTFLFSESNS